ncbi:Tut4 [Symbiodinium natans]|uniref:Tut4 protein n=1 Tax=Symbiodinium natans TaxID=878477 RepID=A0A812PYI7_9DINO|nr:Tut4 [Symbiodinium natans]
MGGVLPRHFYGHDATEGEQVDSSMAHQEANSEATHHQKVNESLIHEEGGDNSSAAPFDKPLVPEGTANEESGAAWGICPGRHAAIKREVLCVLLMIVQAIFDPSWQVMPFGSSVSGFGTDCSDLDVSCQDSRIALPDKVQMLDTLEKLWQHLQDDPVPGVELVQFVTKAACPIIKLRYKGLPVDISNNPLPLQNTRLLAAYAGLDDRVRDLGRLVKMMGRSMRLQGAHHNYLSSYAWILMVLFYLQRAHGMPVLCVDDVVHEEGKAGKLAVESARREWDWWIKSTVTVPDLLQGFFHFYSQVFRYGRDVVAIGGFKDIGRLTRDGMHLDIQDPIQLERNLAEPLRAMGARPHRRLVDGCRYAAEKLPSQDPATVAEDIRSGIRLFLGILPDPLKDLVLSYSPLPPLQRRLLCRKERDSVGDELRAHYEFPVLESDWASSWPEWQGTLRELRCIWAMIRA